MESLELVGVGATSKVYRDGKVAVKIYQGVPYTEVCAEARNQQIAFDAGLQVPSVHDVCDLGDGRVALRMDYVDGLPLVTPRMDKDERRRAIAILTRLQKDVHDVRVQGLPNQSHKLTRKIARAEHLSKPQRDQLISLLESLWEGEEALCHGDFHPMNILHGQDGLWIIDWVDASSGEPLADACRTYLLIWQYMKRSATIYLRQYCTDTGVEQDAVLKWMPVMAGARLSEPMDKKVRTPLLAWLGEWFKKTD